MITFKYKNKIITTPDLDKKLKRMKLQLSDIEIIETPITKEKESEEEIKDKRKIIVRSTEDDIRRVCYIPLDYTPTIYELFKNQMWNPTTKTGIKDITYDKLMTMYYEN